MSRLSRAILTVLSLFTASSLIVACGSKGDDQAAPPPGGVERSKTFVTVLTGPTSGVYYPVGGAFAGALDKAGYKTSTTATGATAENIQAILAQEGEIAIAMADAAIQAYNGADAFDGHEPAKDLRVMMGLWPNVCQIVTTSDAGIKSFADLKGKRVGVGAPNSGVEVNARMIFAAHGMTYDDAKVDYLDYGQAIDQIKNGQMDAAFVTSAIGNATIQELGVSEDLAFVPVEGDALKKLTSENPYYIEAVIPANAYGTAADTTTAAVMNVMLVSKDLPGEVVKDMLELIYGEGLETIAGSHATAKENITLETALRGISGIDVPLHPGAEAFYAAKGMDAGA
ncbi:MAG: TAXI family TRAP transporter solute-binding subunit [Bifidobacteriaceae bacterium]|jgi:TRAP transporter TAXI family solute receptor|nr:TAXI family TRAP transporter solute-binding subunit [Bifidobacteriaceae bacterium]